MNKQQLQNKLRKFDDYFRNHGEALTERERIFSRIVKLNEEIGELCEAVLCEYDSNQRNKGKLTDVDKELADVLICTLLIALNRKGDIWKEVEEKINKQLKSFGLE